MILAQIDLLQREIARVQARINAILGKGDGVFSCSSINNNLYFGLTSQEVRCLQHFLKSQDPEIYPQGLLTGYFGHLTEAAVIRFQERYAEEILTPINLEKGTGFVGEMTREKINELISSP